MCAVVLNYRNWPDTGATVSALLGQTHPPARLVVIDNASGADEVSSLSEGLPAGVELVALDANEGYAGGMNAGLDLAAGSGFDAALLLTHECVLAPEALGRLVDELGRDPAIRVVAPALGRRTDPGRTWSLGGRVAPLTGRAGHMGRDRPFRAPPARTTSDVAFADGAALLLRLSAGPGGHPAPRFPTDYFLYFEETDLQTSVRHRGERVVVRADARAWQRPGRVPPYLAVRNQVLFTRRWYPSRVPALVLSELAWTVAYGLAGILRVRPRGTVGPRLAGLRDGLTGRLRPELLTSS